MKKRKDPTALSKSISYLQNMIQNMATLPSDDEFSKGRDTLCKCVNELIEAVEEKSLQIDGKNMVIQGMKKRMEKEKQQLIESLCKSCKNEIVITKTSSLSIQDSIETRVIIDNSYDLLYFFRDRYRPNAEKCEKFDKKFPTRSKNFTRPYFQYFPAFCHQTF